MRSYLTCVMAVGLVLLAQTALAKDIDPIGYVQSERGEVVAVTKNTAVQKQLEVGDVRPLYRNAALFQEDMVVTGQASKAQLMFQDGTIITMDESSQMRLDQFNFDFNNKDNSILSFLFGPGLFRFLTGKLPDRSPDKFKLDTPLGVVGIRGTEGGVEARSQDAAAHAALCQQIVALEESSAAEQKQAATLFEQALDTLVNTQTVYHFKGFKMMTFTDSSTSKTVDIPAGTFITVTRDKGAGAPAPIARGYRGNTPSIDKRTAPPSALRGVIEHGSGSPGEGKGSSSSHGDSCGSE